MVTKEEKLDLSKISQRYKADVQEFLDDNPRVAFDRKLEDLTPKEFFEYYCHWHGIIGFQSTFLSLLEQLGWTAPGTQKICKKCGRLS